jgi:hypothetical protein
VRQDCASLLLKVHRLAVSLCMSDLIPYINKVVGKKSQHLVSLGWLYPDTVRVAKIME